MRVISKKLENEKSSIYYEQFDNYQEFLRIVEERERTNTHDEENTLEYLGSRKKFVQVASYTDARNKLIYGWDAQIDLLKEEFKKASDELDTKNVVKQFSDAVGFMPIVPNAILGLPNSMLNQRTERKKSKIIKFLIDITISWSVKCEDVIKYYSKVLARIALLEKKGYRCRIEVLNVFAREVMPAGGIKAGCSILIKSENQPFDLKRMAYPISHPSMLRVFGFAWENSLPIDYEKYHCGGLGTPMYHWGKARRNHIVDAIRNADEKIVYVNYRKDLEQIFGKEVA